MIKGKATYTRIVVLLALGCMALESPAGELTPDQYRFDLKFPGGTPQEFADAINKAVQRSVRDPQPVNVLIAPELKDARVPAMELRAVDAKTIFLSLNQIARHSASALEWVPSGGDVWVPYRRPDNRKTQTFYVGNLLQKFKIDDVTTALQTTWQMASQEGESAKPDLKYHQDTQLLIVRAYPAQLETMSEVISELRLAIDPAAARDAKPRDEKKVR